MTSRVHGRPPTVVVSIPCFGCHRYIARSVESILQQTYTDIQVVVVNDGDPRPPWEALSHIDDPRLVRFSLPENYGPYFAHAVVLAATSSPYFLVQDADDWSDPERIAHLLKHVRDHAVLGAISAAQRWNLDDHTPLTVERYLRLAEPLTARFEDRGNHHGLFSTRALRDIGGYYGGFRFGYDTLLINFLLMIGTISFVDQPLYHRGLRRGALTTSWRTGMRSPARLLATCRLSRMYKQAFACYAVHTDRDVVAARIRALVASRIDDRTSGAIDRYAKRLRALLKG